MTRVILHYLSRLFGQTVTHKDIQPVGGGSINQTYRVVLETGKQAFCKINSASLFPEMFQKEKEGLQLIGQHNRIKVPEVIAEAIVEEQQILVLQWIERGERNKKFWTSFGEQLAALHNIRHENFGLQYDNYMGSVPQKNTAEKEWSLFFQKHRLMPLVKYCLDKNLLSTKHENQFQNLYNRLPSIFNVEEPSLLHGDLWSGNFMYNQYSEAVLIDPAVYFGHRSADLAMTTLFGGFDRSFYEAYHYHFPFPDNYRQQWDVCNLYPLLIHLLLFGKSYLHQIEETLIVYQ